MTPPASPVALTGTPGTGKSTVARLLRARFRVVEVAELARATGARPGPDGSLTVSLPALARRLRAIQPPAEVVVGHLAHLLPLRDAVVLRCHPVELAGRLRRARRGSAADRFANFVAEATDGILLEAVRLGRRVWEVDTSHRRPESVAREVSRRLRRRGPASYGRVDWLRDPRVTEHLLDRPS